MDILGRKNNWLLVTLEGCNLSASFYRTKPFCGGGGGGGETNHTHKKRCGVVCVCGVGGRGVLKTEILLYL